MNTKHKKQLQLRMQEENKKWKVAIVNMESLGKGISSEIWTKFNSQEDSLENVLHKIELDLMTNLHYGFKNPIQVYIKETD